MQIDDSLLTYEEDLSLRLRALYQQSGYRRYIMGKFEQYDLYAQFRDFLASENIISFTDTNGKLMALKPDVTLFFAANTQVAAGDVSRVYYNENVYRVSKTSGSFKEIMQVGVECLGDIAPADVWQVLILAAQSLATINPANMMAIASLDILTEAMDGLGLPEGLRARAQRFVAEKNLHDLEALCAASAASVEAGAKLLALLRLPQNADAALEQLAGLGFNATAVAELTDAVRALQQAGFGANLTVDFSLVNDTAYYNGLAFQGFVQGVPRAVLMGGQYDNLLVKLGRTQRALGFAVYMDGIRGGAAAAQ